MKNNPNTLVDRLRDANRYLLPPTVGKRIGEAADRIEELEATVKNLVGVAQDSSYGRHYLRTHYPDL